MEPGLTPAFLEAYLHEVIPVSKLMGIKVESCKAGTFILIAPLEINHNHLGTAFGGSLATIATLAGYCALWSALGDPAAHVVISRSSIQYRRPVTGSIRATCQLPPDSISVSFIKAFKRSGKARLTLDVTITENGEDRVLFTGDFVALR